MCAEARGPSRPLTREGAGRLLAEVGAGAPWVGHCQAVSRVAGALARALARVLPVDVDFAERGGLLHDVGRCRTHHPVLHGVEGYRLLARLGHAREARVCLGHLLYAFDPAAHAPDLALGRGGHLPCSWEERLVPLADFLVEADRPTSLRARFTSLRRRYAENPAFLEGLDASETWTRNTVREWELLLPSSPEALAAAAWTGA